ncbi:MAG: type II toxin-antitoxin system YafQ family toxin [Methanomassiliicoccaceae archaeon]|nr:type II toxin-antitoxin system YafQ family toxin [Methanomassiliicoccaceae archaeon]
MRYKVMATSKFQKDLKRAKKRNYDIDLLTGVIKKLAAGETLEKKNQDHRLKGEYKDCRECHITPDWLLIYKAEEDTLILCLMRTGTHSDLF